MSAHLLPLAPKNPSLPGMILGAKPKAQPIIPKNWKKALFVGVIVTVGLTIAATLCSQGVIHLSTDSWQFKAIAGTAGVMGISQVITLIGFFVYYRLERKTRDLLQAENELKQKFASSQSQLLDKPLPPNLPPNKNCPIPPQSSLLKPKKGSDPKSKRSNKRNNLNNHLQHIQPDNPAKILKENVQIFPPGKKPRHRGNQSLKRVNKPNNNKRNRKKISLSNDGDHLPFNQTQHPLPKGQNTTSQIKPEVESLSSSDEGFPKTDLSQKFEDS